MVGPNHCSHTHKTLFIGIVCVFFLISPFNNLAFVFFYLFFNFIIQYQIVLGIMSCIVFFFLLGYINKTVKGVAKYQRQQSRHSHFQDLRLQSHSQNTIYWKNIFFAGILIFFFNFIIQQLNLLLFYLVFFFSFILQYQVVLKIVLHFFSFCCVIYQFHGFVILDFNLQHQICQK